MSDDDLVAERTALALSEASVEKGLSGVLVRVRYQEKLDPRRLQMPEHLLSLRNHPIYASLSDEQRWRLSLLETVNFFSLNIHGEKALVRELVGRLYQPTPLGNTAIVGEYLQHFIHEENAHTFMLAGYCNRYAGGLTPDVSVPVAAPQLSSLGAELLFFARTLVLETFLDFMNCSAMKDDSIDETARTLHRLHHLEEARHIAFDKSVVRFCVSQLERRGLSSEVKRVAELASTYAAYALKRLYSPLVYKQLGLPSPVELGWEAHAASEAAGQHEEWLKSGRNFLQSVGFWSASANDAEVPSDH
jgi:hypothetical protein